MPGNQRNRLSERAHRVPVHLHATDGLRIRTAPIEVKPPVIVHKLVRIPEREGAGNLPERRGKRVAAAVKAAVFAPMRRAELHLAVQHAAIRRIVVRREIFRKDMEGPCAEIFARMEARRHGGKEGILPIHLKQCRVGSLPAGRMGSTAHLIAVRQIERVTDDLHTIFSP